MFYKFLFLDVCSMDGFRVVKLEEVVSFVDILITATGKRERERDRETETETERDRETETKRETERLIASESV